MDQEIIKINLKDKIVFIKSFPFDGEIDVEEIVKIDYNNLIGEILTFPVLYNRIHNMKAKMQNVVNIAKIDLDVFIAQTSEEKRSYLSKIGKKTTLAEVDNAVLMDQKVIQKKKWYYSLVEKLEIIDGLYWSAQNKSKLLEKISDKIKPSEFEGEIVSATINGVMIKATEKLIKDIK